MDNNTHGAFAVWTDERGNVATAFIDGIPDRCDHDSDGEAYHFNNEGEYFKDSEVPDYHSDPDGWYKFMEDHNINGGCVSCSKCGKPFTPPIW